MNEKPLIIKRRGEDGYKVVSVRMKEELLKKLDEISNKSNRSRNEVINRILEHGVENLMIEE